MGYLANRIIKDIDFDLKEKRREADQTRFAYVGRERKVLIEGNFLRIKLTAQYYDMIHERLYFGKKAINDVEATDWI